MVRPSTYTPELIQDYINKGFWNNATHADLWNLNARKYPDKEALVDSKSRLTWSQAKQWADRVALGLLELGLHKDDVLAVQLTNSIELCLMRIACEEAGIICLALMRNLRHYEVAYVLGKMEVKGVVIPWKFRDFDYFQMIKDIHSQLPQLKYVIVAGDELPEGTISLNRLASQPLEQKYSQSFLKSQRIEAFEIYMVLHTSGTTGFPKFVEVPTCVEMYSDRQIIKNLKISPDNVIGAFGPGFTGPNITAYNAAIGTGGKLAMMEHFQAEEALQLIEKEGITIAFLVPAQIAMMVGHPNFSKYSLTSLRLIVSQTAPLPPKLAMEAEEKLKCRIIQFYGSIDIGGFSMSLPEDPQETRFLTVGKPANFTNEIKIVDGDGKEVPRGEVGEILAKGPSTNSGYYRDPEATRQSWTKDGWFKMGDLGKLDEHGNLMLVGRVKDMINRGGHKIYSIEVENMLISHPKVSSAALVAMPDPIMGEKACAYIIPKAGQTFTFEEMIAHLKSKNIAAYKMPERLEIVQQFPLVAESKVDKKILQQDIVNKLRSEGKI